MQLVTVVGSAVSDGSGTRLPYRFGHEELLGHPDSARSAGYAGVKANDVAAVVAGLLTL